MFTSVNDFNFLWLGTRVTRLVTQKNAIRKDSKWNMSLDIRQNAITCLPCRQSVSSTCGSPKLWPTQSCFGFRENSPLSCWQSFCICFGLFDCWDLGIRPWLSRTSPCGCKLAAYKRQRKRPALTEWDLLFRVGLSQVWSGWRHALIFCSARHGGPLATGAIPQILGPTLQTEWPCQGRPAVARGVRRLIRQMAIR